MISAQLAVTSPSSGYTQEGTIFLYENTPVTLNLVGIHWERVTKVRPIDPIQLPTATPANSAVCDIIFIAPFFRCSEEISSLELQPKTIIIRFSNYQNKTLLVLR